MDYGQETAYKKPKKKRRWPWVLLAAVLAIVLGIALHLLNFPAVHVERTENGISVYMGQAARQKREEQADVAQLPPQAEHGSGVTVQVQPARPGVPQIPAEGGMSLQEIYETVLPSVVTITTQTYGGTGLGTGVILSQEGYIITNQHVIEDAAAVQVQLWDDAIYPAALVGSDVPSDLAVLKIEASGLQPAAFGDSDSLRVGDSVVAIGNPLGTGLRGTMTDGIISGISRDLTVSGRKMTLLQTNAALNNGNSGGPLINCHGQVVGINAVKLQSGWSGSVEGLGFAIPMATVKPIVDDLIGKGYVSGRPAIGITVESLPLRARIYFGLPEGAHVTEVDPRSDAAAKGLQAGDIITAFNGQPVSGPNSLSALKDACRAGDTATLTLFRGGQTFDLDIVLMDRVIDAE